VEDQSTATTQAAAPATPAAATPPAFDPNASYSASPAPAFDPNASYEKSSAGDVAARHARSRNPNSNFGDPQNPGETGMQGVATGFAKGAAKSAVGAGKLANKVLPDAAQIPISTNNTTPQGTAEKIGDFGEGVAEFVGGEGLANFAKLAAKSPELLKLIETYPKASKIIMGAMAGGAQGGVKGAADDQAGKGATVGSLAGAGGTAATEAFAPVLNKVLRATGLGGYSAVENLTKAAGGSVNVGTQDWSGSLKKALPLLKDIKFNTVGEFADGVHNAANTLWKQTIQPQIDRHANEMLDMTSVRDSIQNSISDTMKEHFPDEAAEMERFAATFNKPKTIAAANDSIQEFNARLKAFYRLTGEGKSASIKSDGMAAATEQAVDNMRDLLYNKLVDLGEQEPAGLRSQYGALKEIERVFDKRATVADRQAPMNMPQILAWISGAAEAAGAVGSGHPMAAVAGAIPPAAAAVVKHAQAPTTLIKKGLGQTIPQRAAAMVPAAVKNAVSETAKTGVAGAVATAAEKTALPPHEDGTIRAQLTDGSIVDVHQDDFGKFQQQHPGLKVIYTNQ
jgi:hypothetical protein